MYYNYQADVPVSKAVLYKKCFYVLNDNGEIFSVNSKKKIVEKGNTDNPSKIVFTDIALIRDTLVASTVTELYYLETRSNKWLPYHPKSSYPGRPIFEDGKYIVSATCSGEWGGTVYFYNKLNGNIGKASSTCPINTTKINNTYYVTASLNHESGFTNIIAISDPSKLARYVNRKVHKAGNLSFLIAGRDEASSRQGVNNLIDSIGITCLATFVYNSMPYYLINERNNVTVNLINHGKLVPIFALDDFNSEATYPRLTAMEGQSVIMFTGSASSGFIHVDGTKLTFYSFYNNK